MNKPILCLAALAVPAAVLVFSACGRSDEQRVTVRLAYGRKIHYAPQIIAIQEGYFVDAGVHVQGQVLLAGIQCAEALTTGAADAAVMGDAPGIIAAASAAPVRIVASYGGGERMHRIVASKDSGIESPEDLEGKRVAIQKGSSTHGAFLQFCEKKGLDLGKVRLINLNPPDMPDALASGQIDAAAGSEPWPSNIEERVPDSREVAVLSGLGNTYPLVMLVSAEFSREHPGEVAAVLRATQRAIALMNDEPERASRIVAQVTGVPPEREHKVMRTLEWQLRLDAETRQSLLQTARFLFEQDRIKRIPDFNEAIDGRFLSLALERDAETEGARP